MKDLAVGLAPASFVAELPDPKETKVVPGHGTHSIRGVFAFRAHRLPLGPHFREVFDAYYANPSEKGVENGPHILFARCPDDVESIIRFTNEWGPLHHPTRG